MFSVLFIFLAFKSKEVGAAHGRRVSRRWTEIVWLKEPRWSDGFLSFVLPLIFLPPTHFLVASAGLAGLFSTSHRHSRDIGGSVWHRCLRSLLYTTGTVRCVREHCSHLYPFVGLGDKERIVNQREKVPAFRAFFFSRHGREGLLFSK